MVYNNKVMILVILLVILLIILLMVLTYTDTNTNTYIDSGNRLRRAYFCYNHFGNSKHTKGRGGIKLLLCFNQLLECDQHTFDVGIFVGIGLEVSILFKVGYVVYLVVDVFETIIKLAVRSMKS